MIKIESVLLNSQDFYMKISMQIMYQSCFRKTSKKQYMEQTLFENSKCYPLKRQEKMHLKNDVCWSRLLQIIA